MGVEAVVIVENPSAISLDRLGQLLEAEGWGRYAVTRLDGRLLWETFDWEGRRYFSWQSGPRFRYLGFSGEDGEGSAARPDAPDPNNSVQLTFLKAMSALERIAGGPVYLGVDTVNARTPAMAQAFNEPFHLPPKLDDWMGNWRAAEQLDVPNPGMVF